MQPLGERTEKAGLAAVYCCGLLGQRARSDLERKLAEELNARQSDVKAFLEELQRLGEVSRCLDDQLVLTKKGRSRLVVVMVGGRFDIIHPGHIDMLQKAKALGDVLVVSVARDSTFERNKRKKPFHNEKLRRDLVASLRPVDVALLGSEEDILDTVELVRPEIIALGYDQFHSEADMGARLRSRGIECEIVRLWSSVPSLKTSKILSEDGGDILSGT